MTDEQMRKLKETIVGVGQILEEKIDRIDFKTEDLRRELSSAESTLSEVQDQNSSILQEIEEVKAWCQAIKASQEKNED
jgi:chromosome segregation ATPase